MKRFRAAWLFAAAMVMFTGAAQAEPQFDKPEDAIAYRQSALKLMGAHSGGLAQIMRGRAPFDAQHVKSEVAILQTLAALPWKAFGEGTEGGNARPSVWQDSDTFKKAAQTMQQNVARLREAATTEDLGKIRAAYADTAASCKACHDSFRQRR